jgi:hypothetical protein
MKRKNGDEADSQQSQAHLPFGREPFSAAPTYRAVLMAIAVFPLPRWTNLDENGE